MSENFVPSIKERSDVSGSIQKTEMLHASQTERIKMLNDHLKDGKQGTIVTAQNKNDLWIRKNTQRGILKGVDAMKTGENIKVLRAEYKKDAVDGVDKLYYFCEVKNSSTVHGGKNGTDKGWIYAGYIQMDMPNTPTPTPPPTPETTTPTPPPTPETTTPTPPPTPETTTPTPPPTPETTTPTPPPTPETTTPTPPPTPETTTPTPPTQPENTGENSDVSINPDIYISEIGNQRFWLIGPDGEPMTKANVETKYGEFTQKQKEKLAEKLKDPVCLQAKMLLEAYNIWGGKARTMELKGLTIKVTDSWAETLNTALLDPNASIEDIQKKSKGLFDAMMTIEQGGNEVIDDEELKNIGNILTGYTQENQTDDIRRKIFEQMREGTLGNDGDSERVKDALVQKILENPPQKPEFEWLQSNINTEETNTTLEMGNKNEIKQALETMGFRGADDIIDEIIKKLDEINTQRSVIQQAIREQLQAQDPNFDINNPDHKRLLTDATSAALINAKKSFIQSSWMEFMIDTRGDFRNDPNINLLGGIIGESQGWDFDVADKNWKTIQDVAIQVGITAALVAIPMAGGIAAASMAARGGAMIARTGWALRAASAGGRMANIAGKGALIAGEGAAFHAGFGLTGKLQGALAGKEYSPVQEGYWEAKEWIKSMAILGVMKGMGKGMEAARGIKEAQKVAGASEAIVPVTKMGNTGLLDKMGKMTQAGKDALRSALVNTGNIASKSPLISQSLAMVGTENIYESVFGDKDLSSLTVEEFLEEFAQALVMGVMAKYIGARIEKIGPKPVKPNPEPVKTEDGRIMLTEPAGNTTPKGPNRPKNYDPEVHRRDSDYLEYKATKTGLEKIDPQKRPNAYEAAKRKLESHEKILIERYGSAEPQLATIPELQTRLENLRKTYKTLKESGREGTRDRLELIKINDEIRLLESQILSQSTQKNPEKSQKKESDSIRSLKENTQISPELSQEMSSNVQLFLSAKGPNFSHLRNIPQYIELPGGAKVSIQGKNIEIKRGDITESISPKQLGEKLSAQEWKSLNEYLQSLNKYPGEKSVTLLENGQIRIEYENGKILTGRRLPESEGKLEGTQVLKNGSIAKGVFDAEGKQISGTVERKGPDGSEVIYDIRDIKHPLSYITPDGVLYKRISIDQNGTVSYERTGGKMPKASVQVSKESSLFAFDSGSSRI